MELNIEEEEKKLAQVMAHVGYTQSASQLGLLSGCSYVSVGNAYTMGHAGKVDPRQSLPIGYTIRTVEDARVRLRIMFEELLEYARETGLEMTIVDRGPKIRIKTTHDVTWAEVGTNHATPDEQMAAIIDALVDLDYTVHGTMMVHGIPDILHACIVDMANNAKFVNGAIVDANGKYQKPEGWLPPDHKPVMDHVNRMRALGKMLNPQQLATNVMEAYATDGSSSKAGN